MQESLTHGSSVIVLTESWYGGIGLSECLQGIIALALVVLIAMTVRITHLHRRGRKDVTTLLRRNAVFGKRLGILGFLVGCTKTLYCLIFVVGNLVGQQASIQPCVVATLLSFEPIWIGCIILFCGLLHFYAFDSFVASRTVAVDHSGDGPSTLDLHK